VVDGNVLRNKLIDVETSISDADLLKLNILLNSALQGKSLDDISLNLVRRLQKEAGDYSAVIGSVLEAVADAISESASEKPEVFT
jgi:heat-inducible transcriptional repressor